LFATAFSRCQTLVCLDLIFKWSSAACASEAVQQALLSATVFCDAPKPAPCCCSALQEVESALQGRAGTVSKQLKQLHGRCMMQLEDLVELIRGPLSDLERKVGMSGVPGWR
jgi:hypothetical protein